MLDALPQFFKSAVSGHASTCEWGRLRWIEVPLPLDAMLSLPGWPWRTG